MFEFPHLQRTSHIRGAVRAALPVYLWEQAAPLRVEQLVQSSVQPQDALVLASRKAHPCQLIVRRSLFGGACRAPRLCEGPALCGLAQELSGHLASGESVRLMQLPRLVLQPAWENGGSGSLSAHAALRSHQPPPRWERGREVGVEAR